MEFGPERSPSGQPSEWDFWSGPLAEALVKFRDFENLLFEDDPDIRTLHIIDPIFGTLVFAGVLIEPGVVEIADYNHDPDYWDTIGDDPTT